MNWGIIGPGKIAHKFADDLKLIPGARVFAVASRSQERADEFGHLYDVPYRFDSYEALARHPKVEAIYIATPHTGHHADTLMCLEQRKPVLCEKPFAINSRQVREMIDAARKYDTFLMEALWTKFLPSTRKVVELIQSDAIGKVQGIQANLGFCLPFDPQHRVYNKDLGGGALLDIGIYPVFLAHHLLGMPQQVTANATFAPTGVDTNCGIVLNYADGSIASLFGSVTSQTSDEAHIFGEKGWIRIHSRWHTPTGVSLYDKRQEIAHFTFEDVGHGYSCEAQEVMNCIHEGRKESSLMSHRHSLELMKLLDWIRKEAGIFYEMFD